MLSRDDEALLNDLLDDRLNAADEAALSARLEREPALREAWDELVRAREFLRDAPDPVPPGDFTARVRARLAAVPEGEQPPALDDGEARPEVAKRSESGPAATPIPLAWRRLMTVAYAAAAVLIVGIGVLALKDRDASPRGNTVDVAQDRARIQSEVNREQPLRDKLEAGRYRADERQKASEGERALEAKDESDLFGASAPVPFAEAPPPAAEAAPKPKLEGAAGPFRGPGGQVPPGLREPSDSPAPRPPSGPAGSSRPSPKGPTVKKENPALERPEGAPAADPDAHTPDHALGELLVLEASSLDAGRRLLESVVAGPGARPQAGGGSGPQGTALPTTAVALRRLDPRRDANLLAFVKVQDAAQRSRSSGAEKAKGDALPPGAQPPVVPPPTTPPVRPPTTPAPSSVPLPGATAPTPPSPSAPRPTPAPAPLPPAEGVPKTAGRGVVPVAPFLGVVPRTLTAEEYARLAALLGPADGSENEKAAKSADTLRRIRVVIVQPAAR